MTIRKCLYYTRNIRYTEFCKIYLSDYNFYSLLMNTYYMSIKKARENINDINLLNTTKSDDAILNQVHDVTWKFWNKIKANLKDIITYNKWLDELWKFKKQKSQELIEKRNYNEHTKFYKRINPRIIISEWWKYYINSHDESTSRIRSYFDDALKYTNQEIISTTDSVNSTLEKYWPLLVSFTLKKFLDVWWVLSESDSNYIIFQFRDRVKLPITIENDTERTIPLYKKYKSLRDDLCVQSWDVDITNMPHTFFSISREWASLFFIDYKLNYHTNTIIIKSETWDINTDYLKLALLDIVIKNGSLLKKDNILIEINGITIPFKNFL